MKENFQIESFLTNDISLFFVILSITLLGAFSKDIFSGRSSRKKISLRMVYSSALVVAILLFAASEYIFRYFPGKSFLGVCLVSGLVSVELTQKLITIGGIKRFITDFLEFIRSKK